MKSYIVTDEDGRILRTGSCQEQHFASRAKKGQRVFEGRADPRREQVNMTTGAVEVIPNIDAKLAAQAALRVVDAQAQLERRTAAKDLVREIANGARGSAQDQMQPLAKAILDLVE